MVGAGCAVSIPTFVTDEPFAAGTSITLGEDAARHMRVRRLDVGIPVGLLDGQGGRGEGVITQLAKRHATVAVESLEHVEPPAPVHLILPVADRDRMLWLAEKAAEMQVASWRPVVYRRSKNVTPRGEGTTFHQKARARMSGALAQSRGAWLPVLFPESTVEHAIAARPGGIALVLEKGSPPILDAVRKQLGGSDVKEISIAIGPEGGFEPSELEALIEGGFVPVSLGGSILRFETAAVAGLGAARAVLESAAV